MAAKTAIVVLAAGEGTRMVSGMPKALHRVGGRPMIAHVLEAAKAAGADKIAIVVGPGHDDVAAESKRLSPGVRIFDGCSCANAHTDVTRTETRKRTRLGFMVE